MRRYLKRVSGPLVDRMGLFAAVERIPLERLAHAPAGESSATVRAWHRLLRVARTCADLEGCDDVGEQHVLEDLMRSPAIERGCYSGLRDHAPLSRLPPETELGGSDCDRRKASCPRVA